MRDLAAAESEEPQPQMRIDRLGISGGSDRRAAVAAAALATADEGAGAGDTTAASLALTDALRAGEHGRARFTSELAALERLIGTLSLPAAAEPQPS